LVRGLGLKYITYILNVDLTEAELNRVEKTEAGLDRSWRKQSGKT